MGAFFRLLVAMVVVAMVMYLVPCGVEGFKLTKVGMCYWVCLDDCDAWGTCSPNCELVGPSNYC